MYKINNGIKKNDIVTIDYLGKLDNGDIAISSKIDGPLTFEVGCFTRIKGFNSAVLGMKVGEVKKCKLSPREAFGTVDKTLFYNMPLERLPQNIKIGQRISLLKEGSLLSIIHIDQNSNEAYLDANHVLAGEAILFCITIVSINDPLSNLIKTEIDFKKKFIANNHSLYDPSNGLSLI